MFRSCCGLVSFSKIYNFWHLSGCIRTQKKKWEKIWGFTLEPYFHASSLLAMVCRPVFSLCENPSEKIFQNLLKGAPQQPTANDRPYPGFALHLKSQAMAPFSLPLFV